MTVPGESLLMYTICTSFTFILHTLTHRPFYFVSLDITGCYDSIVQPKLLEIVDRIINHVRMYMC